MAREPKELARYLTKDQLALYRVIWERFLASQMLPAMYDTVAADIVAADCLFRAQGSTLKFAGFMAVYVESREESEATPEEESEVVVPPLEIGEILKLLALDPKQHFTQPPPRFTEASLVKTLEERGIGRPSTYAQILSTIQDRGYVHRERGTLFPTELGMQVNDLLVPHFPEVMDVEFTAQLEESLDKIEDGDADWVDTVDSFYKQFSRDLKSADKKMENVKVGQETGEACPECGEPVVKKFGRFGKLPGVLRLPRVQVHEGSRWPREARRRADRPDMPDVREADGDQARPLRQVHRVLGLPGVQDDEARHARHHVSRGGLRRPAGRAPDAPRQDVLLVQRTIPTARSRSGAAGHRALSEVRRAVLDGALRAGGQGHARVHPRGLRVQGGDRPDGRRVTGV